MLRLASEKPELRVVNDQFGSPTYAHDLAEALLKIATQTIHINEPSIYHYCNQGAITWFDFAKKILELKHSKTTIIPISTSAFPTPARRPSYSVLNTDKIKQHFNLIIPNWQSSLAQCLKNLNP
jgi:dTDP-4-dehydrorhamnose reductase